MNQNQQIIDILTRENSDLRDRIELLEASAHTDKTETHFPFAWHLTPSESAILNGLLARPLLTFARARDVLYGAKAGDEPVTDVYKAFICKLRRKLAPFGITIITRWGLGYELEAECRKHLILTYHEKELTT